MRAKNSAYVLMALIIAFPITLVGAASEEQPQIQDISPTSATWGKQITITGTGFDTHNNDIGFTKVREKGQETLYGTGYLNNVQSKDGRTLTFELPQSVGVCPFDTIEGGGTCIAIALVLDEGDYEVFVFNKNGKSNSVPFAITSGSSLVQKIQTRAGELTLSYSNGMATLSGTLQRATGCVDWKIDITSTKDLPPSNVQFHIYDFNKAVICIQMVGEPQEISATAMAGEHTTYRVTLEDDVVFSGTLVQTSKPEGNIELHMKIKNTLILLSLRNNDVVPVHELEIEATGTAIMSTKTRTWQTEKLDESTVRLHTDEKPVTKSRNLIVLMKVENMQSVLTWKAFDANDGELHHGMIVPR